MINQTICTGSVVISVLLATTTSADIINVPADQPSIQAAIDAAADGDEIVVAVGTYNEKIDFSGKAVALRSSSGPDSTIIDANKLGVTVFCANGEGPSTVLDGFTITGGNSGNGGGMFISGGSSPTVTNCVFSNNVANLGGGIAISTVESPTISSCVFKGNTASRGGGLWTNAGSPTVSNCVFRDNVATFRGGGLYGGGNLTLANTIFTGNFAVTYGGGVDFAFGNPILNGCLLSRNFAGTAGGGMTNLSVSDSSPTVTACVFIANTTNGGGGAAGNFNASAPSFTGCTFIGNTADTGGGIFSSINVSTGIADSSFCDNIPDHISCDLS